MNPKHIFDALAAITSLPAVVLIATMRGVDNVAAYLRRVADTMDALGGEKLTAVQMWCSMWMHSIITDKEFEQSPQTLAGPHTRLLVMELDDTEKLELLEAVKDEGWQVIAEMVSNEHGSGGSKTFSGTSVTALKDFAGDQGAESTAE